MLAGVRMYNPNPSNFLSDFTFSLKCLSLEEAFYDALFFFTHTYLFASQGVLELAKEQQKLLVIDAVE